MTKCKYKSLKNITNVVAASACDQVKYPVYEKLGYVLLDFSISYNIYLFYSRTMFRPKTNVKKKSNSAATTSTNM